MINQRIIRRLTQTKQHEQDEGVTHTHTHRQIMILRRTNTKHNNTKQSTNGTHNTNT